MYVAVRDGQLRYAPSSAEATEGGVLRSSAGAKGDAPAGAGPFDAMERIGVESVELAVEPDMKTSGFQDDDGQPFDLNVDVARLAEACERRGVSICALLMPNRFEEDEAAQAAWLVETIRAAHALGPSPGEPAAVRVDVVAREMELGPFLARAAGVIRRALEETEDTGVPLGVENHGCTSNRPDFLRGLFEAVGSDRFGLTLDTGNFYWYGHPLSRVYEVMEELAPKVKHTHVKNIAYPEEMREKTREPGWEYGRYVSPVPDGDIDHGKVAGILKAAGYAGAFTLEDESYGRFDEATRTANLLRNVEHLKSVV